MLALKPGISIAAIVVFAGAMLTIEANARGGGGGMGGGGWGGGRAMNFSRGGGFAVRSFSGPRIGPVGTRSFNGNRFFGRPSTTVGRSSTAVHSVTRFSPAGTASSHVGSFARTANVMRAHAALGNRVISNVALRSAIAPVGFHGRFPGSPWPWWQGGIVLGWIGPVFWPYVYYDFFGYVFWPYVYDDFWPYAYDDIYYGIYGPYAYYGASAYIDPGVAPARRKLARGAAPRAPEVCSNPAVELTDWPIQRISDVVKPTDTQALDELKAASAKAVDQLKATCPNDLPSIPTGRLAAMEVRLEAMLSAVRTVRPALDRFYLSLSDEQKARFNAVAPSQKSATAKDQRNLAALCSARTPGVTNLPIDRIATAVGPSEVQRAALDELKTASIKAAESFKADCPTYQALTPAGRVEAMEQRLTATLAAVKTVQPALVKFYNLLSNEQKARFNVLRTTA
jgi:hypothetical protein